jgi:hypothetical protein
MSSSSHLNTRLMQYLEVHLKIICFFGMHKKFAQSGLSVFYKMIYVIELNTVNVRYSEDFGYLIFDLLEFDNRRPFSNQTSQL